MTTMRAKISAALDRQALIEGDTPNIQACRIILARVVTLKEWQTLTTIRHHRYGVLSYETHRFYYVREWVFPLASELLNHERQVTA